MPNMAPELMTTWHSLRRLLKAGAELSDSVRAACLIAAAASQGHVELLEHERANLHGTAIDGDILLQEVAGILLASRGEQSAARVLRAGPWSRSTEVQTVALRRHDKQSPPSSPAEQLLAFLPAPFLQNYLAIRTAAWSTTALAAVDVQLVLCCVNAADREASLVARHAQAAMDLGASPAHVVEAITCAIPAGGITAIFASAAEVLSVLDPPIETP